MNIESTCISAEQLPISHATPKSLSSMGVAGRLANALGHGPTEIPGVQGIPWTHERNRRASIRAALVRWSRVGVGALRGMSRLLQLGPILVIALADAAIVRLTTPPTAPALARSRAAWLHRWSRVVCCALGLQVERHGFAPVSGLVIVSHMSLVDALVMSAMAPFVFVVGMEVRRRPLIGWLARFAGTRFHDDQRHNDLKRIQFMIERALQRRQVVVFFHPRDPLCEPGFLPESFLQATGAQCSLTPAAIRYQVSECRGGAAVQDTAVGLMMQPRRVVAVTFHPPSFHPGDRSRLARQLWNEVRTLEQIGSVTPCGCGACDDVGAVPRPTALPNFLQSSPRTARMPGAALNREKRKAGEPAGS